MAKFTVTTSDELDSIIAAYCKVTGRTRNGVCLQWIQDGAIKSFKECKQAGLIPDNWIEITNGHHPKQEEEDNDE